MRDAIVVGTKTVRLKARQSTQVKVKLASVAAASRTGTLSTRLKVVAPAGAARALAS